MDRELVGGCSTREPVPALFALEAELGRGDWERAVLACACGDDRFRIVGWPRAAVGRGGVFWRTFARVFREVRAAMQPVESARTPFFLPLTAMCARCGREAVLFDRDPIPERLAPVERHLPQESYRCRVCRRSEFSVAVAVARGARERDRAAALVRVHCRACHRTATLAASDARPSEREQRLDLLYGRS